MQLATTLGLDKSYRSAVSERIKARSYLIWEDFTTAYEWVAFLAMVSAQLPPLPIDLERSLREGYDASTANSNTNGGSVGGGSNFNGKNMASIFDKCATPTHVNVKSRNSQRCNHSLVLLFVLLILALLPLLLLVHSSRADPPTNVSGLAPAVASKFR